jgi:hypothetical protein
MPNMLTLMEQYNGLGYAYKGLPSPYVWSGTDQYTKGKYIRDKVFDPNVVDKQLGVAGLIRSLQSADPTIQFPDPGKPVQRIPEKSGTHVAPEAKTSPEPSVVKAGPSVVSTVLDWLKNH